MLHKSLKLLVVLLISTAAFGLASIVAAEETLLQFNLTATATDDADTLVVSSLEEDTEVTLTVLDGIGVWRLDIIGPDNGVVDSVTSVDFEDSELFLTFIVDDGGNYAVIFTNTGTDPAEISGTIVIETNDSDGCSDNDGDGEDDGDDDDGDGDDDDNGGCDNDGDGDDDDDDNYNIGVSVQIYIVINIDGSFTCNFYGVDDDGDGFLVITITTVQIQAILADYDLENLTENILLMESEDGLYTLWYLTTGEYQINSKPDKEGKVEVLIYDSFPPTRAYRADFNVYDILNPDDEGDDD